MLNISITAFAKNAAYELNRLLLSILLCFCCSLYSTTASADFTCSTTLSYKWIKTEAGSKAQVPASSTPQAEKGGEGAAASEPSIVTLTAIEKSGVDEAAAKAALQVEVSKGKIRASDACQRDHESFATCMVTKLKSDSSTLGVLSFSARKKVEEAIAADCKAQQGTCLTVESSEPKCVEKIVPTPAGGAEAGKGDKKDAKKK